jgi:hypothetical protein
LIERRFVFRLDLQDTADNDIGMVARIRRRTWPKFAL